MSDPVSEVAAIIEGAADDARAETLDAVAQAETLAHLDSIETKLETIEAHTPETPVSAPMPTTHEHPEIVSAIESLKASVERMGSATADVAETAADAVEDVAEPVAAPVAEAAAPVAQAVESAPKRGHLLFKRWFGG